MARKIVKAADLLPPRRINDDDFDAICRTSTIPMHQRAGLRAWLNEAVEGVSELITGAPLPSRKEDRLAIERAIKALRRAEAWLKRKTGPAGRRGLRTAGRRIAPVISASWIRRHFPYDLVALNSIDNRTTKYPDPTEFLLAAAPLTGPEVLSLDQRIGFMERRGVEVFSALLGDVLAALEDALSAIVKLPDGRKPLENREFMLAALAECWHRLGRKPTSGIRSKFGEFCEAVFDATGWPTEGVNAALADAKNLWRTLYHPS